MITNSIRKPPKCEGTAPLLFSATTYPPTLHEKTCQHVHVIDVGWVKLIHNFMLHARNWLVYHPAVQAAHHPSDSSASRCCISLFSLHCISYPPFNQSARWQSALRIVSVCTLFKDQLWLMVAAEQTAAFQQVRSKSCKGQAANRGT